MNEIRRNTLISFYYRMKNRIETDMDLILFIQAFEALQKSEGHRLESIYQEDFNQALLRHQLSKSSQHQPKGQKMEIIGVKAQ